MPEVWFFRKKVVKRREKDTVHQGMISVLFVPDRPDEPGLRITVSQRDWADNARSEFYEAGNKPSRDDLAKKAVTMCAG